VENFRKGKPMTRPSGPESIPDVRCSRSDTSFDKDVGHAESRLLIEQEGDRVTVTETKLENGCETGRETVHGTLGPVFADGRLVQLRLDDGRYRYFDVKKRAFDNNAGLVFERGAFPGFSYCDERQLRLVAGVLFRLVALFRDGAVFPGWIENVPERTGAVERGHLADWLDFAVHFPDGAPETPWFAVWFTAGGLPDGVSIRSCLRREGADNWDFVIKCPPDRAAAVTALVCAVFGRVMPPPGPDCPVCGTLQDVETSYSKYGSDDGQPLPEAANRLVPAGPLAGSEAERHHLRQCPACGCFYEYLASHEYMINGTEEEETLTRLDFAAALRFLAG
jgi:hypothetical protein